MIIKMVKGRVTTDAGTLIYTRQNKPGAKKKTRKKNKEQKRSSRSVHSN